jgi:hypothetical protein
MMAQIEGYDPYDKKKKSKFFFIRKWGVSMIFFLIYIFVKWYGLITFYYKEILYNNFNKQ